MHAMHTAVVVFETYDVDVDTSQVSREQICYTCLNDQRSDCPMYSGMINSFLSH